MSNIKPTINKPISQQAKNFESNFNKTMKQNDIQLNEVDSFLNEDEKTFKKKIFDLDKMQALIFSDPKLSAEYDKMMGTNGEGKFRYGYHANEMIVNTLFNQYVLNDRKYLEKYKMAIPKEKKRRDMSGINQLKKAGEEEMIKKGEIKTKPEINDDETNESTGAASSGAFTPALGFSDKKIDETTSSGSAGSSAGYVGYATPSAWSSTGKPMIRKPIWKGGSVISESNYLTESDGFEKFINELNDVDFSYLSDSENKDDMKDRDKSNSFMINKTSAFNSDTIKQWDDEDAEVEMNTIKTGKADSPNLNIMENRFSNLEQAKLGAKKISKEEGVVQHVNQITDNNFEISDWYDSDKTVASYENGFTMNENSLNEKAKSAAQQRFMGMVRAVQKGDLNPNKVGEKVKKAAEEMKPSDVEDFASTKHNKIPEKIDEDMSNIELSYNKADTLISQIMGSIEKSNTVDDVLNIVTDFVKSKNIKDNNLIQTILSIAINKFKNKNNVIKEESQSMIDNNPTSMSNKATTNVQSSSTMETGMRSSGSMSEGKNNIFEELDNELKLYSNYHNKLLKNMSEDRKPSALVLKDRVGDENVKNFKSDMKKSDTKNMIDIEKELQYKDQQTEVGENPQELSQEIENKVIENTKGNCLDNVGSSDNNKGNEIPKRNLTKDEQNEVDMYRLGMQDLVYDNKPSQRFEDRMKADMGEKLYKQRQDKMEFRGKAPMYNKDTQPTSETNVNKSQYDKQKSGWNEREGLNESFISGRYFDFLGKRHIIDFKLNESNEITDKSIIENLFKLDFTGLGNKYVAKSENKNVLVNESVNDALSLNEYYTDSKNIFHMKASKSLNESKAIDNQFNEGFNKLKHLLNYNPNGFVSTKNVKNNRGF